MTFRGRLLIAIAAAMVLPVAAVLLYQFPPASTWFYPKCIMFWITGIHCPGCGALRAMNALLHGDLQQALAYNVVLVAAMPFMIVAAAREVIRWVLGVKSEGRRLPAWVIWVIFGVFVGFAVLRNIPVEPFKSLAPHELQPSMTTAEQPMQSAI